jgi:hypothetical protein
MTVLIFIAVYLLTIFIGRYLDIKVQIHQNPVHYKQHIQYGKWFMPIVNILYPIVVFIAYEIENRRMDCKHNAFVNWFFVGRNYKTKQDLQYEKELDEFFKFKHKVGGEVERDMTNYFK